MMEVEIKDIVEFYREYPQYIGQLLTNTKHGIETIEYADVTAYDSNYVTIETDNGVVLETSQDHILWSAGWKAVKDLKIGDCLEWHDGSSLVITSLSLSSDKEDLYDLQISRVKEFYANGIRSHNSTMLDAIVFALFGKPFRKIKKGLLANSINKKEMVVEIYLDIGGNKIKIIRGESPKIFQVYENEVLIPEDSKAGDYQKMIETQYLKCNYKTFTQIVILGSATYVPFMELEPKDRRLVIEDILDIGVFTEMGVHLKEDNDELKDNISHLRQQMEIIETKISTANEYNKKLEVLKNIDLSSYDNDKEELSSKLNDLNGKLLHLKEKIEVKEAELSDFDVKAAKAKLRQRAEVRSDIISNKRGIVSELKFLSGNENCPVCKQAISKDFRNERCASHQENIDEIGVGLEKLERVIDKLEKSIDEAESANSELYKLKLQQEGLERDISSTQRNIRNIEATKAKMLEERKESLDSMDISVYKEDHKTVMDRLNKLLFEKEVADTVSKMLKDGGIKSDIVKKYIPHMNKLINEYLIKFDLFVNFVLDENFDEKILSRYRDNFSYESFSQGEKLRINLAIMLTWKEIAKLKNSISTNLLILDETLDGALDEDGVTDLIKALRNIEGENNNIFVISHRGDSLKDLFDTHYHFEKIKNFSTMTIKQ